MGRFTEDMGRLRDDIEAKRVARQTFIEDNRQEVADAAQAFISDLKSTVETLQADFRAAHADMADAARTDRNAFLTRLGGAVADLRAEAGERRATVRDELAETAAETRADLEQATAAIRDDVAQMQDGFRQARGVMAVEVKAAGQSFVANIVDAVADLQRQTLQMVGDFADERAAGRRAWRGEPAPAKAPPPAPAKAKPAPKAKAAPPSPPPPVMEKPKPVEMMEMGEHQDG